MDFFCLIETKACRVPYLEWLPANSLDEARIHAKRILQEHRMPVAAHIIADNKPIEVLKL